MNLIFRTMRLGNFMTSYRDNIYYCTISSKFKFIFLIILFGKISGFKSLKEVLTSKYLAWSLVSDLASNNDAATIGMDGRIDNKTWWKCKCCASMETSTKGSCCLEIVEICKPKFSSALCSNVSKSDPDFVLWYSMRENFVSYLIST